MEKIKELNTIENRTKYFLRVLGAFCILSILVFASMLVTLDIANEKKQAIAKEKEIEKINPFTSLNLEAKAFVVWDVINKREIFSKNSDLALPLASLTKVMTAVTVSKHLPDQEKVLIKENYLAPEGDSGLLVGDFWNQKDLQDFTLLTSSNDGAYALAAVSEVSNEIDSEEEFIQKMNELAIEMGLLNSKFLNTHGLDKSIDRGGAYGSAKDMALLFEYAMRNIPDLLEATRYKSLTFQSNTMTYQANNTNTHVDEIPGLIASKTGFTDLAGGNLVIAFNAGLDRPIIVSVLGSSREGRFNDSLALVHATLEYIKNN